MKKQAKIYILEKGGDYSAIFSGTVEDSPNGYYIEYEDSEGVVSAVEMLRRIGNEDMPDFTGQNVVVIGVSKDSVASHLKFAEKYELPFVLLSDPELQAIQAYGVWQEKKLYGKVSMGVVRSTYLIDEQGVIEKVMPKVKPDTNAAEILAYLKVEG